MKERDEAQQAEATRDKTIGVKVPPDLYARLQFIKKHHGLRSLKDAVLLCASLGSSEAITIEPKTANRHLSQILWKGGR